MTNAALSRDNDTFFFYKIIIHSANKSIKVTAQGVWEHSGPVGVSSGVPDLTQRSFCNWANDERRLGLVVPSRLVNATRDQSFENSEGEVGRGKERRRRTIKKGRRVLLSHPLKKNTKLLEFSNEIREVVEGKEPGSLDVSGNDGGIPPRIVSVATVKEGYMASVVKGTSEVEENSFVTWLSIAGRPVSKAIDVEVSASEKERFLYRIVAVTVLRW